MNRIACLLGNVVLLLLSIHTHADDYALSNTTHKSLMVALGCFWCAEQAFEQYVPGVVEAVSGYACGTKAANTTGVPKCNDFPTYRNHPGHYEVIRIEYDPMMTSYEVLVRYAWRNLDPFNGKGQFCDYGTSYLPAIFYANEEERIIADSVLAEVLQQYHDWNPDDIKVPNLPRPTFWKAEEYHQNYYIKNPKSYGYYKNACGRTRKLQIVWGEKEYKCYHDYNLEKSPNCMNFTTVVNEEGLEVDAIINLKEAPEETIGHLPLWGTILVSVMGVLATFGLIMCCKKRQHQKKDDKLASVV